jgi:SPP1 gp7 family putative phage head morphogenesis protein
MTPDSKQQGTQPWPHPWTFADVAKAKGDQGAFRPSRAAERAYERQLRGVAGQIKQALKNPRTAADTLRRYARTLEPWAQQSAANMMAGALRKNEQAWRSTAQRMGLDVRMFMATDLGHVVQQRISDNVALINSMVLEAADKVGGLVQESMSTGIRAEALADRIVQIGNVTASRARVIAATEVSKASTALTAARAASVGSEGYIWRTARDGDTRESHRAMEGKFVRWDSPPTLDGMTGHAGEFPNCRCYPEPVIANDAGKTLRAPIPTAQEEQKTGSHVLRSHWEKLPTSPVVPHMQGEALVGADKATFDLRKATDYVLSPDSPIGKHKARMFQSALGFGPEHAEELQRQVMGLLPVLPAARKTDGVDLYGERFNVLVPVTGANGKTVAVNTSWIYDRVKNTRRLAPRLVTMRVSEKKP